MPLFNRNDAITDPEPLPEKATHGPKFMASSSEERSQLLRVHHNLGHPDATLLSNVLRDQGWPAEAIEGVKDLHCSACFERQKSRLARPSHLGEPRHFNDLIAIDSVKWINAQTQHSPPLLHHRHQYQLPCCHTM